MAQLAKKSYPLPDYDHSAHGRDKLKAREEAMGALQDASHNVPKGEVVGLIYSGFKGDGYAHYLVTKETPLTLQHIPIGDSWELSAAEIRGLRKQDILDHQKGHYRTRVKWLREAGRIAFEVEPSCV